MLLRDNYEILNKYKPEFGIKQDRIAININNTDFVSVPSRKYPLSKDKDVEVFVKENTEILVDDKIKEIFDNTKFQIGKCYKNIEHLKENLEKENITNFKVYIGWLFSSSTDYPVHHCFIVYDNKYLLDSAMVKNLEILDEEIEKSILTGKRIDKNDLRIKLAKYTNKLKNVKNSEKCTFGKINLKDFLYVGTECTVEDGKKIFKELIGTYPNHPAYASEGMNSKGASKIQSMIDD